MFRVIAIAVSFLACSLCGFQNAFRLEKRSKLIGKLIATVRILSDSVELTRKPVAALIRSCTQMPCYDLFERYAQSIENEKSSKDAWRETEIWMGEHAEYFRFCEDERNALGSYFEALSTSDGVWLKKAMEQASEQLLRIHEQAQAECARKGKVYRSLGVLIGAAIAILLV